MHISDSSKKKYNMALYILLNVLLADIFSWLLFFIFSMFSMFSKLAPGSPIQGGRMEQF